MSHTALRHYFSSRDELLVEAYRTHEARAARDAPAADESAVGLIVEAAERNRSIPGLVELYATLTTDALQEQHAVTREFVRDRFRSLRADLAARIESGQRAGSVAAGHRPAGRGRAGDRRVRRPADPVAARSRRGGRRPLAVDPRAAAPARSRAGSARSGPARPRGADFACRPPVILSTGRFSVRRQVVSSSSARPELARWRWAITAAFGLGGITISAWGPRLPAIKADLGVGTATLGLLLAGGPSGPSSGCSPRLPCCTGWAAAGPSRERSCSSPPR